MIYSVIQLASSVLAVIVFIAAMRLWKTPRAKYFIFLCLATSLYAVGYFFELGAHSLEAVYLAERVQYLGIPFIGPLFYLFIRDYTRRGFPAIWQVALLFVIPCFTLVFANAWPDTTLYFADISFSGGAHPQLLIERGPFFYVDIVYSFGLIVLAAAEILRYFPRRDKAEKRQRLMFVLAAILPVLSMLLLLPGIVHMPMDVGSGVLAVSGLILLYYVVSRRLQDWLPYARERVMESMQDGFVLIDSQNCYLDANRVAKGYFPVLENMAAGTSLAGVEGFPLDLLADKTELPEYVVHTGEGERVLRVSLTHVDTGLGTRYVCVMLYDVTELRRLMGQLEDIATHDSLTGLLNRGTFFYFAQRDFELASRSGQEVSMLMLDIDFFKNVNDRHGHQCGDEVLKEVATILTERLRRTDICGRYGGEEFCVFLPAAGAVAATMVADIIRRAVAAHTFACDGEGFHVTVSIGVAQCIGGTYKHLDALISDADNALYTAKHGGRNRVVLYAEEEESERDALPRAAE